MWVMNEDGTRDVEEDNEDELASPPTLLRRILQHDSNALTAGFEVRRGGIRKHGTRDVAVGHVHLCDMHVRPDTRKPRHVAMQS